MTIAQRITKPITSRITTSVAGNWWGGNAFEVDFINNKAFVNYDYSSIASLIASPGASFTRASTGLAQNIAGVFSEFAIDAVRITDKGLINEDLSENLMFPSDTLTTGWATGGGLTIDINRASLIFGDSSAMLCTFTGDYGYTSKDIGVTLANTAYRATRILEKGTLDKGYVFIGRGDSSAYARIFFDLTLGVITGNDVKGSGVYVGSGIEEIAPNIFEVWVEGSIAETDARNMLSNSTNGAGDFKLYYSALELASNPRGTPIRTLLATETREADDLTFFPAPATYDITGTLEDGSTQLFAGQIVGAGGWTSPANAKYYKNIAGVIA